VNIVPTYLNVVIGSV